MEIHSSTRELRYNEAAIYNRTLALMRLTRVNPGSPSTTARHSNSSVFHLPDNKAERTVNGKSCTGGISVVIP